MVDPVGTAGKVAGRIVASTKPIAAAAPTGRVADPATGADEAQVELPAVTRALAGQAPVDTARVADLKAKIARGDYALSPEQVADRMLADKHDWDAGSR